MGCLCLLSRYQRERLAMMHGGLMSAKKLYSSTITMQATFAMMAFTHHTRGPYIQNIARQLCTNTFKRKGMTGMNISNSNCICDMT